MLNLTLLTSTRAPTSDLVPLPTDSVTAAALVPPATVLPYAFTPPGALEVPERVVCAHYAAASETATLITADSTIISADAEFTEPVGDLDAPVAAMAFAPDDDLVVLVTASVPTPTVLLFNSDWFPLTELPFLDPPPPARPPDPAVALEPQPPAAPPLATHAAAAVAWRSNGEAFAVNAYDPASDARRVAFYSRSGDLTGASDPLVGLGTALAWRPTGELIASSQRFATSTAIVFFEPNGLRHGKFDLLPRHADARVVDLVFAPDASVLAVHLDATALLLYHRANFEWALKHAVVVDAADPIVFLAFDPYTPTTPTLTFCTASGAATTNVYAWDMATAVSRDPASVSTAAVLASNSLRLTHTATALVPPPMSSASFDVPPEHGLAVGSPSFSPTSFHAVVQTTLGAVVVSTHPADASAPALVAALPLAAAATRATQLVFHPSAAPTILALSTSPTAAQTILAFSGPGFSTVTTIKLPGPALRLASCPLVGLTLVELADGRLFRVQPANALVVPHMVNALSSSLPAPAPWLAAIPWGADGSQVATVALSAVAALYVNGVCVATGATSFALHARFLLYTTTGNMLAFVPRTVAPGDDVLVDSRPIERGSRLVAVTETGTRVVLVAPRGNLESFDPRPLVMAKLHALLDAHAYGPAFVLARTQRIDFNTLVDYDTDALLAHIDAFVDGLATPEAVNLVLTRLSTSHAAAAAARVDAVSRLVRIPADRKASAAALAAALHGTPPLAVLDADAARDDDGSAATDARINAVADGVRAAVAARPDAADWALTTVTTHAIARPPQLEAALAVCVAARSAAAEPLSARSGSTVRVVVDLGAGAAPAPHSAPARVTPAQALDYLTYLVDVNDLYDAALGMYDFDLVRLVATRTDRDPAEFEPELAALASLPAAYMRFTIDVRLGRHARALAHLHAAVGGGERVDGVDLEAALLAHVSDHSLFTHALDLGLAPELEHEVRVAYGRALQKKRKYVEGGTVLARAGAWDAAVACFVEGGEWRAAFVCADRAGMDDEARTVLAYTVADALAAGGRGVEAGRVLVKYTGDVDAAVDVLVRCEAWMEAVWAAEAEGRSDLVETVVAPGVDDAGASFVAETTRKHAKWVKGVERLIRMREREQMYGRGGDGGDGGGAADDDVFSDASSVISGWTTAASSAGGSSLDSGASMRSAARAARKREKRRKAKDGKKKSGEPHLLDLLERGVPSAAAATRAGALVRALLWFGNDALAADVQRVFDAWLLCIERVHGYLRPAGDPGAVVTRPLLPFEDVSWKARSIRRPQSTTGSPA